MPSRTGYGQLLCICTRESAPRLLLGAIKRGHLVGLLPVPLRGRRPRTARPHHRPLTIASHCIAVVWSRRAPCRVVRHPL